MNITTKNFSGLFLALTWLNMTISTYNAIADANDVMCLKTSLPLTNFCQIKRRRYDVINVGKGDPYFHGWVDVQGLGYSNDFCRLVKSNMKEWFLSCALAGSHGEPDTNYNASETNFDVGLMETWYMKDEDEDGRDDYCRCLKKNKNEYRVTCTKAGIRGFYGSTAEGGQSNTFDKPGSQSCNHLNIVRPEFGIEWRDPLYPL